MNNAFNAGQNIGSVLGDLFTGKSREPGAAYYDQLKQNYGILGEKNRADKLFEEAGSQRAMNIARSTLTPELMARFLGGDQQANAELGAAIMRANSNPNLTQYTAGALQNQELGFRQDARDAALPELGAINGNLAGLANGPLTVNTIDDGYQINPLELGGAAIATPGKVADIRKTNREMFDNGNGVYNVDFGTNSATPITVGPMPELGQVQNQYAELGAKHGFQTTSVGRTPEVNARANGVKNSQHLGDSPTARDWSIKGKSPEQIKTFISDLQAQGYEAFVHDAGSGQHVHAELPPGSRRGTPSLLSGKPGGGTTKAGTTTAKATQAANTKQAQALNVERGLGRIEAAMSKLNGSMIDTGPIDQYAQKFTPEGQELEAAVGAIQNSLLSLTRVPGIGAQSDLEAKIAMLQYPSLSKDPQVNKNTLANLRLFVQDLLKANGGTAPAGELGAPAPAGIAPGHVEDGYRFKGGDPANQSSWVKI